MGTDYGLFAQLMVSCLEDCGDLLYKNIGHSLAWNIGKRVYYFERKSLCQRLETKDESCKKNHEIFLIGLVK